MHKPAEGQRRLLLLSHSSDDAREQRLLGAVAPGAEVTRSAVVLPEIGAFDAVLLVGEQQKLTQADVARLTGYVEEGGRVLAVAAASADPEAPVTRLLGFTAAERLPAGEFFGRVIDSEHDLARRLRPEFPFVDSFAPLMPANGGGQALVDVSVNFRDRVAIAEHVLGSGRVVVSALGATERALEAPELRSLLRRALRPRDEGPSDRTLGVAIIGYGPLGGMGYAHALAVSATAGLELTAICDTNQARLESAGLEFPGARLVQTVDEVAADPRVDLAIVATPPSSHTALSLQLLRAGKHVVCEKPLCFTVAEADQLFDTALANGRALTVNQNRRWDADFLTVRGAIEAGLLGDVFNVETFVGSFEHPCREWHSEAAISGGAEFDWGAHYIDWILQLLPGQPSLIYANGHKRVWHDVSNLDQVRVRMVWDDGREAEFIHSDVAAVRRPKFYIQGTQGTLVGHYRPLVSERIEPGRGYVREESHHAEAPADLTLVRYEPLGGGLREQHLSLVQPEPFAFHRNLADHLLLDDPPLAIEAQSTRALIAVLEAAHKSAERGGRPMTPA